MKTYTTIAAYVVCLTYSVGLFFRHQIASGFAVLFGDNMDTYIQIAILEHWYNVLGGHAHWSKTFYFAPYKGTLAYNDGYFLFGLPYALFRWVGMDPFLSNELVNVVLRIFAFVAFHLLLRRSFRLNQGWSLFGAVLFTTSCTMAMRANHAQLLCVGFVPFFAWMVWSAVEAYIANQERRFVAWGGAAAIFMACWLMTAYYMAWFTLFFLSFFVLLAVIGHPRALVRHVRGLSKRRWIGVAAVAAIFLLSATPFLRLYLPKARATGMHAFSEALSYTIRPVDLLNTSDGNLLLGRLDTLLKTYFGSPNYSEQTTGFTLFLLIVFVTACCSLTRARMTSRDKVVWLLAATTVLTWTLTLRFGDWTAWAAVYALIPGAKGLRVVARYQLFLAAPVIVVAAYYLAKVSDKARGPLAAGVVLIALVSVAEQITVWQPIALDRAKELAVLHSVPVPPAACRAFFVSRARAEIRGSPEGNAFYNHNVDAMLLAEMLRLPTVNGFSTFMPPDWNFVGPDRPDYPQRVHTYVEAHHLGDHMCALDMLTRQWDIDPRLSDG